MRNRITSYIIVILVVLVSVLYYRGNRFAKERDKYEKNTDALLSDIHQLQLDSTTMAIDVKTLRLTVDEYKRYRAEDALKIKNLGIRLQELTAAGKIEASVDVSIQAPIKDTVFLRDTVSEIFQKVEIKNEYMNFSGIIKNKHLSCDLHVPVRLQQAFWIEYKHKFLWWKWKVKAVHQTISSDNPYVRILYSEFINIEK